MKTAVFLFVLFVPFVHGDTLYVPDHHATIQGAIDAAQGGDTIIVRSGTYVENIDFKGKAVTVQSEERNGSTIIDGNGAGSVVTFKNGEGADSILDGFTVTNGSASSGCGIYCEDAAPSLLDNYIINNRTPQPFTSGGGIFCLRAVGGRIAGNIIRGNQAGSGGGISCYESNLTISDNVIDKNITTYGGGGIGCSESIVLIRNNMIHFNTGDGVKFEWNSVATLVNNTIYDNTGNGVYCFGSSVIINNTLLWNNKAAQGPELWVGDASNPSVVSLDYCNVKGGLSSVYLHAGCTLNWGTRIIVSNPAFVDPVNGDFHIYYNSPCRGSGTAGAPGISGKDFEGDPRVFQGVPDIGADEFHRHFYVYGYATPGGTVHSVFVGLPGKTPVALFIGSAVLPSPMKTPWGPFHLASPYVVLAPLGVIPSNGCLVFHAKLPATPAAPYDIPLQALIGLDPDSLSNLFVLEVR
jgi:hypothetical protein